MQHQQQLRSDDAVDERRMQRFKYRDAVKTGLTTSDDGLFGGG